MFSGRLWKSARAARCLRTRSTRIPVKLMAAVPVADPVSPRAQVLLSMKPSNIHKRGDGTACNCRRSAGSFRRPYDAGSTQSRF
jgi:hypothetical protein